MKRFLLDTNVLLGLARRAPWARNVMDELDLEDHGVAAYTSVICHGEILALAEKNGWGPHKRIELDGILRQLPRLDINREAILNAYALIDAWTHGKPVASPGGSPPPRPAVSMAKNDLWIAATAHASHATLVSTDGDFLHLRHIWFEFIHGDRTRDRNP